MAVVDFFLKVEGVEGESQDSKHKGEIQVQSWSWGETNGGSVTVGGGMGSGKVQMQDFHFTMWVNKASPKLFLKCATGEHLKKVILTCRKAGKDQQEYLTITFTDSIVSSYQTAGQGDANVLPVDQCAINFAQIDIDYKEQKPDGSLGGSVKAGYNLATNKAV